MEKQLLIETALFIATPKSLNESMGDPNGKMIVEGLIQKAETKNGNGRIYPYEVLKREAEISIQLVPLVSSTGLDLFVIVPSPN